MTYDSVSYIAQTWGLVYFVVLFGAVLVYALWPRNRRKFHDAANIPFKED
ncbi:MAG: cytochrome c oxidase cbb3-type subunit 4 [Alphaproteobacteria bacterium]|jgi:cytochrome c oxidase cbb3-type subunit 4